MKFDLKRPCPNCPFRTDIAPYLTAARVEEITTAVIDQDQSFACHETTEYSEESGDLEQVENSQFCAGAMLLSETGRFGNQWLQLAERLTKFDPAKLDRSSPVFKTREEMIEAQAR